jgi:hypothetical protein
LSGEVQITYFRKKTDFSFTKSPGPTVVLALFEVTVRQVVFWLRQLFATAGVRLSFVSIGSSLTGFD